MIKRYLLLSFLAFMTISTIIPTITYAMSLDDDEEDAEDVADLISQAKQEGKNESFDKANELLEKAKMYGVSIDDTKEATKYIADKKQTRDDRLERERKEKARLARLKRERKKREERARVARLTRDRQQTTSSNSSSGGSITLCVPYAPKRLSHSKCRAKTLSGSYENATVDLFKDSIGDCYTLSIYGGKGYGGGNTCSGLSGGWAVSANGNSGYANDLSSAIAWLLKRM